MGLDNGVYVKCNEYTNTIKELQQFEESWDKEHKYDFEICYWRKCYNIRSKVVKALWDKWSDECHQMQVYYGQIDIHDVDNIIKVLQSFNSKNWQDNGGSIWDWDDEEWPYSKKIKQDIKNLKKLRKLMDGYELEVYFEDSY
jgi:hypothetical protein